VDGLPVVSVDDVVAFGDWAKAAVESTRPTAVVIRNLFMSFSF
jgi:hypothetical protein